MRFFVCSFDDLSPLILIILIMQRFVITVRRWRAARGLPRGRWWRWRRRAVRSTRSPRRPRSSSQSTPRGYGSGSPPVSTAPVAGAATRPRRGGRSRSLRGARRPQARQGCHIWVSAKSLVSRVARFAPLRRRAALQSRRDRT